MSIHNRRRAAILGGPVVAHRQTKLVRLASRFSEQRKLAHRARTAALHRLFHARVGNDEFAIIKQVMAHKFMNEICGNLAEAPIVLFVCLKLCERISQASRAPPSEFSRHQSR